MLLHSSIGGGPRVAAVYKKMESFMKIVNTQKLVAIVTKNSILVATLVLDLLVNFI